MPPSRTAQDIGIRLVETDISPNAKEILGEGDLQNIRFSGTYSLSDCNALDKYTLDCQRCIATILTGTDKSGQQVSELAHISPYIFNGPRDSFREAYTTILRNFRKNTVEGTRTVGLAGGTFIREPMGKNAADEYRKMVHLIGSMTGDLLETVTRVLTGPKLKRGGLTHLYCSTQQRFACVLQTPQQTTVAHAGFDYWDLPEEEERWKQDLLVNIAEASIGSEATPCIIHRT